MDNREQFEDWVKHLKNIQNRFNESFLGRYSLPKDDYKEPWASNAWVAWQASRKALSSCSENPNSSDHIADIRKFADGSQEEFEDSTSKRFQGLDLSLDSDGDYDDLDAQQHWETWQASRQGLEGEAVAYVDGDDIYFEGQGDLNDHISKTGVPLYTHPASAQKEIDRWKTVAHDQAETIGELQGLVHNNHRERASVPNEHGKNRYGLDMAYFRNLFNRELNRPLTDFRPDELARVLARAARAADREVLGEAEFRTDAGIPVSSLGRRKAAEVGKTIGVLVQNRHGEVAAVTDLGRVTWLPNDVVAPPKQEQGE